jgi:hypothetical protein
MKTPEEIAREMHKVWGGLVPAAAIEEALITYGDERAREMRERCALMYGFVDEWKIRQGRLYMQDVIRALPLEVNDE